MTEINKIMTSAPVSISPLANVNKARMLMADTKIRHLPVVDSSSGRVVGLLNQKALLSNAIKIIKQRGFEQLEHVEKSLSVENLMDSAPVVCNVKATVVEVAKSLREKRSGCICIEDQGKLVGVVTSSDFVKLAAEQLTG